MKKNFFPHFFSCFTNRKQSEAARLSMRQLSRLTLERLEDRVLLSVSGGTEELTAAVLSLDVPETPLTDALYTPVYVEDSDTSFFQTPADVFSDQSNPVSQAATVKLSTDFANEDTITSSQLRTLIYNAGPDGTVVFDKAVTVDFSEASLTLYSNITFSNESGSKVSFEGKNSHAFFLIKNSVSAVFDGIDFTGGNGIYSGQSSIAGGAFWNSEGTLKLINCSISNCSTSSDGGAIYSFGTSSLENCSISNCSAIENGGAISSSGALSLENCSISNCSSSGNGGAIIIYGINLYVVNTQIYGNSALGSSSYGGAIANGSGNCNIYIINSTIAGNVSSGSGGGIFAYEGNISVYNSIMILNYAVGSASDIYNYADYGTNGSLVIDHSLITKGNYCDSNGLLKIAAATNSRTVSDPRKDVFVTAPSFGNGLSSKITNVGQVNLSLQKNCSALIDSGRDLAELFETLNLTVLTVPETDLAGNTRVYNSAVDLGAFEDQGEVQQLGKPTLTIARRLYNRIKIAWESVANADSYNLYYRKTPSPEETGDEFSLYQNVTDTFATVNDLDGNTSYDFYVIAVPSSSSYCDSENSEIVSCFTSAQQETAWTSSYTPQLSKEGASVTVSWSDSGADKIYLKYYYTCDEIDMSGNSSVLTPYHSGEHTIEVQSNSDQKYTFNLIYGSVLYVKIWDNTLNESDVSWTSINISIDQATEILINDKTVDVFKLASNPDSNRIIYLDFTGHVTVGTCWNSSDYGYNISAVNSPVFSYDDLTIFSSTELETIYQIWLNVSEDYAPFDVNVTTIFPGLENLINSGGANDKFGIRTVIGGASSILKNNLSIGGIAYHNSFGWQMSDGSETPCFIFSNNLQKSANSIAEAATHEIGHTLGLSHRGGGSLWSGEYSYGITSESGVFNVNDNYYQDWAPIMGASYYSDLTQWTEGTYYYHTLPYSTSYNDDDDFLYYYIYNTDEGATGYQLLEKSNVILIDNNDRMYDGTSYYPDDLTVITNKIYTSFNMNGTSVTYWCGGYLNWRQDDYTAEIVNGSITDDGTSGIGQLSIDTNGLLDVSSCLSTIGYTSTDEKNNQTVSGFSYTGLINSESDQDIFMLTADSCIKSITLNITGTIYGDNNFSDLPVYAYLYKKNESGTLDLLTSYNTVYTAAMSTAGVTLTYNEGFIAEGTVLYLVVDGGDVLLNNDNYSSDYGSMGYYLISGSAITTRSVTQNLSHLTSSNTDSLWISGDFETTLSVSNYYSLPETVTVAIGGNTLTSDAYTYNSSSGNLLINETDIPGNIIITANAVPIEYNVMVSIENGSYTSSATTGTVESSDFSINLTANTNYLLSDTISVVIGSDNAVLDTDYTYDKTTGIVVIKAGKITDKVSITATPVLKTPIAVTQELTASLIGVDRADLTFLFNDADADISVSYKIGQTGTWSLIPTEQGTGLYYSGKSIYHLDLGTSYYFKVSAESPKTGIYYGTIETQTVSITTTTGIISGYEVVAYNNEYDGTAHGIKITGLDSNCTVEYSSTENGTYSQNSLLFTNVTKTTQTVWYKISKAGYNDVIGSSTVNITPKLTAVSFSSLEETNIYTYNAQDQSGSIIASATGINGETLSLSVSFVGTSEAALDQTVFKNAGEYSLTADLTNVANGQANTANYQLTGFSTTATIHQKVLTVIGGPIQKFYDETSAITIEQVSIDSNSICGSDLDSVSINDQSTAYDCSDSAIGVYYVELRLAGSATDNYRASVEVQIIPTAPQFSKKSYSVSEGGSVNISADNSEIAGVDRSLAVYSWSFDGGKTWFDSEIGKNNRLFTTGETGYDNVLILEKLKYNNVESGISENPATLTILPAISYVSIESTSYLDSRLLKLDICITGSFSSIDNIKVFWSESSSNYTEIKGGNFTFCALNYYSDSNTNNYNLSLNFSVKIDGTDRSYSYFIGTHSIPEPEMSSNSEMAEQNNEAAILDDKTSENVTLFSEAEHEKLANNGNPEFLPPNNSLALVLAEEEYTERNNIICLESDAPILSPVLDIPLPAADVFKPNHPSIWNYSNLLLDTENNKRSERDYSVLNNTVSFSIDNRCKTIGQEPALALRALLSDEYFLDDLKFEL